MPTPNSAGWQIDRGIGPQPAMKQGRHATCVTLAGRTGQDDVSRRPATGGKQRPASPSTMIATPDRSSATPQPWMRPPSTMPAKGSRCHRSRPASGSPSGWAKKMTLRPLARSREGRDDALALAGIDCPRAARTRPPSARRPAGSAPSRRRSRARARRRQRPSGRPLHRRVWARIRAAGRKRETRVSDHQIAHPRVSPALQQRASG